ncbi:MAG: hypothetical protein QOF43_2399 [Gaiellaceae bacterium]|nr:hypothetical protein [Gaiellaceae bacterium]
MSRLSFLSVDLVPEASRTSPLAAALVSSDLVRDVSALGKLELRGDVDGVEAGAGEELVRLAPGRALLITQGSPAAARERLGAAGLRVYDLTGALAGLEIEGEALLRRLTELDLEALPATGPIARGVPALVQRLDGERFRLLVPQELGHYVCETVLDLAQGVTA